MQKTSRFDLTFNFNSSFHSHHCESVGKPFLFLFNVVLVLSKTMRATKYFVENARVQSLFMCLENSKN